MLKTEDYKRELEIIFEKIKQHSDTADIRGSDVGSFIFAKKSHRAIEIYQSENDVIVEFWEDEEQKSESEVHSYKTATEMAITWLKHYEK